MQSVLQCWSQKFPKHVSATMTLQFCPKSYWQDIYISGFLSIYYQKPHSLPHTNKASVFFFTVLIFQPSKKKTFSVDHKLVCTIHLQATWSISPMVINKEWPGNMCFWEIQHTCKIARKCFKKKPQTCNTVGRGVLLISSLINSTELRVAHANGSYVEWFGENIVQSSPGSPPHAVSPARVNRSIGEAAFSAASFKQQRREKTQNIKPYGNAGHHHATSTPKLMDLAMSWQLLSFQFYWGSRYCPWQRNFNLK